MLGTEFRRVRIDRHAADRVDRALRGGGAVVVSGMRIVLVVLVLGGHELLSRRLLSIDTLGGYIAGMQKNSKTATLKRLSRIEGQVRGIARMVDEDVYCIDILTQVSAVTKALQAVSIGLVEDHLGHCVVDAARQSPEAGAEKVREAADAIARLVRS